MYAFEYHRPQTVDAAVALLRSGADPQLLAGGQTLIPTLKQRLAQPSDVIDLAAVTELAGIQVANDAVVVGAMTTHAQVANAGPLRDRIPGLAHLASLIGDPQVRHRGTLGGSIVNNDPAADYPGAILALGATVVTDRRTIAADDFFTGMFETCLDRDELVRAVRFPIPAKAAYAKLPNPASRYAIAGVMVAIFGATVRVAVTGAAPCAFRWREAEAALETSFTTSALDPLMVATADLNTDLHASAEYRAHLVKVMGKRAVAALV